MRSRISFSDGLSELSSPFIVNSRKNRAQTTAIKCTAIVRPSSERQSADNARCRCCHTESAACAFYTTHSPLLSLLSFRRYVMLYASYSSIVTFQRAILLRQSGARLDMLADFITLYSMLNATLRQCARTSVNAGSVDSNAMVTNWRCCGCFFSGRPIERSIVTKIVAFLDSCPALVF